MFSPNSEYKDFLISHLPEMAEAQAGRTSSPNQQGWLYLRDFARQWLAGAGNAIKTAAENNGEEDNGHGAPGWVDWGWLMQYARFRGAVTEMLKDDYLFSADSLNKLTEILEQEGAFSGSDQEFNHIDQHWTAWRSHAFQGYPLSASWSVPPRAWMTGIQDEIYSWDVTNKISLFDVKDEDAWPLTWLPDGLFVALGNFTVYARAAGRTYQNGNSWRMEIKRIALFVYDGFEFSTDQWLGRWRYTEDYKGFDLSMGVTLDNRDFRDFRARTRTGQDFRILSRATTDFTKAKSHDKS
jgi:hypothetical protein